MLRGLMLHVNGDQEAAADVKLTDSEEPARRRFDIPHSRALLVRFTDSKTSIQCGLKGEKGVLPPPRAFSPLLRKPPRYKPSFSDEEEQASRAPPVQKLRLILPQGNAVVRNSPHHVSRRSNLQICCRYDPVFMSPFCLFLS